MCGFRTALRGAMPVGDRRSAVACRLREWRYAGFAGLRPAVPFRRPTPLCRATRRQGNADLWSAQPAAGGRPGRTPSGPAGMKRWCGIHVGRARRYRRRFRAPARAGPHRENCPEVGVPLPAGTIWAVGGSGAELHFRSNWPAFPPPRADRIHATAPSKERPLDRVCRAREKKWQRTLFAAVDFGGKCERGLPPFTINNDKSELAAARLRRARKFRFPARSAGRSLDGAPT